MKELQRQHVVYLLTINDVPYIGQTINFRTRKRDHLCLLRRGVHHNYQLQEAFNKYGSDAVGFRILESGISNDDIRQREQDWIMKHDAINNGFNLAPVGMAKPVSALQTHWNGIEYENVAQAARANGVEYSAMYDRIKNGYRSDDDIHRHKIVRWNGVEYKSISAAARANKVSHETMSRWITLGFTCRQDARNHRSNKLSASARKTGKSVTWEGVEYKSITAAARAANITLTRMWTWQSKGYRSMQDAIEGTKRRRRADQQAS